MVGTAKRAAVPELAMRADGATTFFLKLKTQPFYPVVQLETQPSDAEDRVSRFPDLLRNDIIGNTQHGIDAKHADGIVCLIEEAPPSVCLMKHQVAYAPANCLMKCLSNSVDITTSVVAHVVTKEVIVLEPAQWKCGGTRPPAAPDPPLLITSIKGRINRVVWRAFSRNVITAGEVATIPIWDLRD
jgi:hypothetical protein